MSALVSCLPRRVSIVGRFGPPLLVAIASLGGCGSKDDSSGLGAGGAFGSGGAQSGSGGGVLPGSGGAVQPGTGGAMGGLTGSGGGGACHDTGQPCNDTTECCVGICNKVGPAPEWIGCQLACQKDSECATGCCLLYTNADHGFCTDAKWCSCGDTAARCGSTLPKCCDTHACVGGDSQGSFYECRKKCTQASDCDTNCCVPIPTINVSACLAPSFCGK